MNKKDMFIKEKLQQDKKISNKANMIFEKIKEEYKLENDGKKVITISLNKFITVATSLVIVGFLGVGLYVNALKKSNTESEMQAINEKEKQVDNVSEDNELSQYIDNEKMGVEFSYPENWYSISNEEDSATIRSSKIDESAVIFEVRALKNENKLNIEEWLLQEENNDINYKNEASGKETVDGYDAWFVTGNIDMEGNHMYRTIYVNVDNVMYEIIYGGDENLYNEFYNVYENILKTVKFKEPAKDEDLVNNDEEKNDKKEVLPNDNIEKNKKDNNNYVTESNSNSSINNNNQQESYLIGDANCDGNVDIIDARWILQYVNGDRELTSKQSINSDVNNDGEVTMADAKIILEYTTGNIEKLPYKEYLCGDANCDGNVDIIDARWILQYVNGDRELTSKQSINSDVNNDGEVTMKDAEILTSYSSGNIEKLPYKASE